MNKAKNMINLITKSVGLATGVAVTVLSVLNEIALSDAVLLLAIGVAALGINRFTETKK